MCVDLRFLDDGLRYESTMMSITTTTKQQQHSFFFLIYFNARTAIRRDWDMGTNRTLLANEAAPSSSSSYWREEDKVTFAKPCLRVAAASVGLNASRAMRPVAKQNDWYNLCEGIASLTNTELSFGGLTLMVSRNTQNLSRRSFLSSGVSCLC